jgi:uncharacterized membrane protein
VAQIAKQALFLNIAIWISGGILFALHFTIILIPLAWAAGLLLTPIAVLLPIIGAIKAANGELFRYPVIGNMI